MNGGNIRAELLAAARSLILRDPEHFSVTALCKKTGLTRAKIRRHFPTKRALMAAMPKKRSLSAKNPHGVSRPKTSISTEEWFGRRLSAVERAISILEAKSEQLTRERNCTITLPEERLLKVAISPSTSTKFAPLTGSPLPAETRPRNQSVALDNTEIATSVSTPTKPLATAGSELREQRVTFAARETMQNILRNGAGSKDTTMLTKLIQRTRVSRELLAFAGIALVILVVSSSFFSFDSVASGKLTQIAADGQSSGRDHDILVIDASGVSSKLGYHQASGGASDLLERAEGGDAHSQVKLAQSFLRGDGASTDPLTAARWSEAAAVQGEPTAQFIMGALYDQGVKPNPTLAFQWFSAAALGGNVKAMHNLAISLLNGSGVAKDSVTAASWFARAANMGYRDSAFDLAVLYERGEGVAQSPQNALKWYDDAASLGDAQAKDRASFLRSQLPPEFAQK